MAKQIAIVEDDPELRANYVAALTREGYRVDEYAEREPALRAFQSRLPDLVIIDVNLQDDIEGGFELCRELRALSRDIPIIFLTARDSEFDAISGLRLGADDYLTKDISLAHLLARLAALFRRVDYQQRPSDTSARFDRGELNIDADRFQVSWQETPVALTLTEFWLIHALAKRPGHVKSRQQLMDAANVVLDDNTITPHIKRIRKKFQEVDADFARIETVYGMGYRWLAD
ncbi:MAG: proteobacterial dedicated sortase system response regulator [Pseudomonadota bacterium]